MSTPSSPILTQEPLVRFESGKVQPPGSFYMTADDVLQFDVWTSVGGLTVSVAGRFLLPDGTVVPFDQQTHPPATRTQSGAGFRLGEGFLLNAFAWLEAGGSSRGQTFVRLIGRRGLPTVASGMANFVSGYLLTNQSQAWPGGLLRESLEGPGFLRSITGTTPAAGAEIVETVPSNARWRLQALRFNLQASAVAGGRFVRVAVDDGANISRLAYSGYVQTVSQGVFYNFSAEPIADTSTNADVTIGAPPGLYLGPGWRIRTFTNGLLAGDQYTAPQYMVEEWIEGVS